MWRRLRPSPDLLARCLAAIEEQRASVEWRNGFAPYLSTWLHQRRYEDVPDERAPQLTATAREAADISQQIRAIGARDNAETRQRFLRRLRGLS